MLIMSINEYPDLGSPCPSSLKAGERDIGGRLGV